MHDAELAQMEAHIHSLSERLIDTARFLKGIEAVVEGMNRGAADRMQVAIHAVEAVAEDLSGIHPALSIESTSLTLRNPEIAESDPAAALLHPAPHA